MSFQTQSAVFAWRDGRVEKRLDDTFLVAPLQIHIAQDLDRRQLVALLRHVARTIEDAPEVKS